MPVLVEKDADEILNKIYSCRYWQKYGQGKETSKNSEELRDKIWQLVMPHIDVKSLLSAPKEKANDGEKIKTSNKKAMNKTQTKGTYTDISRIKEDKVIASDECYTFYQSVEMVANWFIENIDKNYFKDKVIYCNCDDTKSAFWIYFYNNFEKLGLKKLIASAFDKTGLSYGNNYEEHMFDVNTLFHKQEYNGYIYIYNGSGDVQRIPPHGEKSTFHGDFKEKICYDKAKNEADIVITNPPFGKKWKQYVETMLTTGKKLIFWGNGGAPLYNWFMELLDNKKLFIVRDCSHCFLSDHYLTPLYKRKNALAFIYTTEDLSFIKPNKKHYSTKAKMLKDGTAWYDDNNILICDKATIPIDTNEILGVSCNIIKDGILNDGYRIAEYKGYFPYRGGGEEVLENINYKRYAPIKNGKECFARVLIQKK